MQKITLPRLRHHIAQVPQYISRLSAKNLSQKPQPDKWSKKEILGHLIDSALYNLSRFTQLPISSQPYTVQPYPQDELVIINDYQHQPIAQLVATWQSLNRQIAIVMAQLSPETFAYPVLLPPNNRPVTFAYILDDYVQHLEHHLAQIFTDKAIEQAQTQVTVSHALEQLAQTNAPFITTLIHGSMEVELYVPEKIDLQQPHSRDELYVVISGEGMFVNGEQKHRFKAGDILFVKAGVVHRFEDFSADFKTWVIFYGPEGGEVSFY